VEIGNEYRVFFCNASFLQILTHYFQKEVDPTIFEKLIHINFLLIYYYYYFSCGEFLHYGNKKDFFLKYFVVDDA
jgi:hypothetical protein